MVAIFLDSGFRRNDENHRVCLKEMPFGAAGFKQPLEALADALA